MKAKNKVRTVSNPVAVVDIGATFLRLTIAEKRADKGICVLERAEQSVALGRNVVKSRRIDNATIEQCVLILRSFGRLLLEFGIPPESVKAVASAAVQLAENSDAFLDRLSIASRISFRMLDPGQVGYYYHLAFRAIPDRKAVWEKGGVAVMEIGGLTCGLLYRRDGDILFSQTYNVGSLRIRQQMEASGLTPLQLDDMVEGWTREMALHLRQNVGQDDQARLLLMGRELRFAAAQLRAKPAPGSAAASAVTKLSVAELGRLALHVKNSSVEELTRSWQISYPDAEILGPTLCMALSMAQTLSLKDVYVSHLSFSDGLLVEAVDDPAWTTTLMRHIVRIARETGEKYLYDARHAAQVTDNALALFDLLRAEHDCTERHRLLLEVAALLHDIGVFVNARGHHKHSLYLIRNTEFIGLSLEETNLIAVIARYHRKTMPQLSHPEYAGLTQESRLVVSKLAAILRVADALDRVHDQSLGRLRFELESDALVCIPDRQVGTSAEQVALGEKGDLFERIYGRRCYVRCPR
jgi:exopolyphosphatase / guanosine-5'-triphosphate,3'-diphosphate pyrophosphatase